MLVLHYEEQGIAKTFELPPGKKLIGRLPTSDLPLRDPSVSRHHASLRVADGRCFVLDAGSRFGTYINGKKIEVETELLPGGTVKVGEISLLLEQKVPEQELLSEDHEISDGPGTIYRQLNDAQTASDTAHARLIKLLAEVGQALRRSQSLPDILNRVVDLAFEAVPADRAFLMLRESADEGLTARVLRHRDGSVPPNPTLSRQVVRRVMRERVAILASDATSDPNLGVTDSIVKFNIRSFMCAPIWGQDEVNGVLYVDSPRSNRFTESDLNAFTALANAAAVAIDQARLSTQLLQESRRRERLSRYHSPAVVSRILHDNEPEQGLRAQEREVTVMFCDIVGFTTLVERMQPIQAATLLNTFLARMTDVVFEHEGTLDKYLGDALLVVFGAPFDQEEHQLRAVETALAMRKALADLNAHSDGPKLNMRIAIASGIALTGDIGSSKRREFTVLGDVVNTASRIEDEVAGPGEIVMSDATYEKVKHKYKGRSLGTKTLRGRASSIECWAV